MDLLLASKADVNVSDTNGQTPLANAYAFALLSLVSSPLPNAKGCSRCYKGNVDVVNALLQAGAEIHSESGVTTALHQCAVHGHDDCLAALLQHKTGRRIDVNILDKDNSTPLHKVCTICH